MNRTARTGVATIVAVIVLAASALACGSAGATKRAERFAIGIKTFQFTPKTLRVPAGATIVWTNDDDIAHTITAGAPGAKSPAFDSGAIELGAAFTHTFGDTGTVPYFCAIHDGMTGEIVVG